MRKEIDQYGNIFYFNDNEELHREDGPAIEFANGAKEWHKNGLWHREDGPAIEFPSGEKQYWYNDVWYSKIETDEEWVRFVKLMVFL